MKPTGNSRAPACTGSAAPMGAAVWALVLLFAGVLSAAPIGTPDSVIAPMALRPALLDDGCAAVCAARPSARCARSDAPHSSACAAAPLRRQAGRDANRRKTSEVDAAAEAYQATQNFGYDANDRLVGWERTPRPQAPPLLPEPDSADTQTWDLDALGNWSTTTRNGITEVREHSPVHAITTIADVPLVYDANGNLTQDHRGRVSSWDEDNRLVSVSVHDADENVSGTATMVYDALGRRLARTAFGRTTVFVLNGSQVIQERDAATVVPQADVVSDGTRPDPVNPGPAPEGAILDLPGTWHITHQPSWTGIPTGWMADKGRALAERTHGLTYGWERGGSPQALQSHNSFQRGLMPQPELDTLHRLREVDASATWRCALPNGNYAVVIISGDAQTRAHTNHWLFNGQALIDPDPYDPDFNPGYSGGDFDGWAVDVVVEDGFLTLAPGPGALDPRLCLIEIGPPGSVVDDDLRAKLTGIIERATRRSEGGALHPPSPRTYAYGGDYIDAPLAMRVGSGGTAQTYFVHTNHLYSPQALTDATGQVVERYSYTAYGERTVLGGTSLAKSGVGFNHGFTGLRNEGHLLFARNRYFAPEMGRWTSRDPAGYVDGYALYNGYFVPNAMDPEGLSRTCPGQVGDDLTEDELLAWGYATGSAMWGSLDARFNAREASYAAYQWMGFDRETADDLAWLTLEASNGNADYNSPLNYFNAGFQNRLLESIHQHEMYLQREEDYEFKRQMANQMYYMAVAEFSTLLISGFNPFVMAQNIVTDHAVGFMSPYIETAWNYYGMCFVAGTRVLTDNGYKNIEDIEIGDVVIAANSRDINNIGTGVVTKLFKNLTDTTIQVNASGHELSGTITHPMYVKERGWTLLGNVRVGDSFLASDGSYVVIEDITVERHQHPIYVYNFEVDGLHTYYVSSPGSLEDTSVPFILVRNTSIRPLIRWAMARGASLATRGRLGELAMRRSMARAGFQHIKARLPSNTGFDGVFYKGGKFIIVEAKFSSRGVYRLNQTVTMGKQMGPRWIQDNINKMKNIPELAALAHKLDAENIAGRLILLGYVVNRSGTRWIK